MTFVAARRHSWPPGRFAPTTTQPPLTFAGLSRAGRGIGHLPVSATRQPRCNTAAMDTATDRISWFPVPDEADLPPDLQGLFRKARERIGFVPNVFRTYAFRPERLSAWFAHFRLLHEETPGLSAAEREMIAVVVSMANGCLLYTSPSPRDRS